MQWVLICNAMTNRLYKVVLFTSTLFFIETFYNLLSEFCSITLQPIAAIANYSTANISSAIQFHHKY